MPFLDPDGGFSSAPDPGVWASHRAATAALREAAGGASLMLWPEAGQMGAFVGPIDGDTLIYEKLQDIATTTRASKAWHPNWDFVSGSEVGPLVEFPNNAPVIGPGGLLVSTSVENVLTNPRGEGAGTAMPSGWAQGGSNITKVGSGVQDGWPYFDIKVHGNLVATEYIFTNGPVVGGGPVTASLGFSLISGSTTAANAQLYIDSNVGAPSIIPLPFDTRHRRWWLTRTLPPEALIGQLLINFLAGTYNNAVFRIFAPQLTKSGMPLAPVLPPAGSPGASVKAADLCELPVGGWYRHDEGTIVTEFIRQKMAGGVMFIGHPNLYNGRSVLEIPDHVLLYASKAGETPALIHSVAVAPGERVIAALSWSSRQHRGAVNAFASATTTLTFDVPAPAIASLGYGGAWTDAKETRLIERARFFPRFMSTDELVAITTPYWRA